ncbi:hypothetical protein HanXRQr2_Chr15g0708561 [Helianthus annuus]|uniref:Uncharacterized protein n=2 Tax=Helianthus annuus TaxID=4232 RepID=A0A9K3E2X9_HELAN|nr:hypothetical protein HanXRQr2_Chr15g0708561 [Helianthus annuus]KAJ0832561.1 hypothetical protein HanPSC8_Chr15g0680131 [Helianthus annuus]
MPSLGWRMGRVVAKDVEAVAVAVAVAEPGKALGWWRHKPQFCLKNAVTNVNHPFAKCHHC